jgi:hypothetical protein
MEPRKSLDIFRIHRVKVEVLLFVYHYGSGMKNAGGVDEIEP